MRYDFSLRQRADDKLGELRASAQNQRLIKLAERGRLLRKPTGLQALLDGFKHLLSTGLLGTLRHRSAAQIGGRR